MILARTAISLFIFLTLALPLFSQPSDDDGVTGDTLEFNTDTTELSSDTLFFQEMDDDSIDFELPEPETFFRKRGGFYGGGTVELTTLDPNKLDPLLSGNLVIYGAEGYMILDSWVFGGAGTSAVLYDLNPAYDQFSFGYGGFLTGYDTKIFHGALSLRGSLLIGAGGVTMIRKRPDLTSTNGLEILERYREEGFFCLRPGIGIGFSPVQFTEIRLGADYLWTLGGEKAADLRNVSYGLHLIFGLGD